MPWLATQGSSIVPLLFAAVLAATSIAIGRRMLIILGALDLGTVAERGVIAVALGAVGALGVRSLRIAAALVVVVAAPDLWAVARAGVRAVRRAGARPAWLPWWLVALAPVVLTTLLMAMAPTIDPDGLGYHLTVPKRWLQIGRLEYLPTYPYSNAPMGAEMLFALALAVAGDAAAKCVHFTLGILGFIGLYLAGARLRGPMAGAVAATLFLVGPVAVSNVLGCAYVEGAAAFEMIAAALAWILWYESKNRACLRCAALLAGSAVTFKITAALLPAALVALTWVAEVDHERGTRTGRGRPALDAALRTARLVPLVSAPLLPWLLRSAIVTGNPFFPLFARWIPSRDFSPDLSAKFDRFNRLMTWGNVVGREWSAGQRAMILAGVCAVVALLGAWAFVRAQSWMARGTAAVATAVVLVQILAAGLYVRYSIPLAAVVALPVVLTIGPRLSHRAAPAVLVAVALLGSLIQTRRCLALVDFDAKGLVRTALGIEERAAFLRDHLGLYSLYEQINRDVPSNAGVMLSCYCGGFYIDRTTYCADMTQNSLRFTSWDDLTSDVRRLGITYAIAPSALATGGPAPPFDRSSTSSITREAEYRYMRPLLSQHSKELGAALDQGLYELDPALDGSPTRATTEN